MNSPLAFNYISFLKIIWSYLRWEAFYFFVFIYIEEWYRQRRRIDVAEEVERLQKNLDLISIQKKYLLDQRVGHVFKWLPSKMVRV
jgi:hypothetical protein